MEPIDGFCATSGLPPLHGSDAALRHSMGFSVIDSLATLHAVDYRSVGLHDFGKPDGFLARQVSRWLKQLDSYARYPAWNGRSDIPGIDEVAGWLSTHVPRIQDPTIIHGDFHLGNILFSRTGPDVRAIVDWELATIGDPLVDLGCLLATWADSNGRHPGCISVEPWSGFPEETELVGRYAQRTGRDVTEINWYVVLACFKLGILQEGTYARAAAGQVDRTVADWLHSTSIKLFERALDRIKGNRNGLGF
jgi:aminoglycoside phosphotransferase (APT) family kinase protein